MAENEEQGREMRRSERRIAELDVSKGVLKKKEDESEVITNRDIMKTDRSVDSIDVLGSSDGEEQFDKMSDLHDVSDPHQR